MRKSVLILLIAIGFLTVILIAFLIFIFKETRTVYSFDENCDEISSNGAKSILFLPNNFQNEESFKKSVFKKINSVEKTEPFEEAFNYYIIKDANPDLGCEVNKDSAIVCDSSKVQKTAKSCPHDFIVVISNQKTSRVRSSAYLNFAVINSLDSDYVLIHELGHVVGKLADEYVEQGRKPPRNSPNCDNSKCEKWMNNFQGVGCFNGCTNSEFYRPTENSIMRDLYSSKEFGNVNIFAIKKNIQSGKPQPKIKGLVFSSRISYSNGKINIESVDVEKGFAPAPEKVDNWFYSIEKGNKTVVESGFNDPTISFEDGKNEQGDMIGGTNRMENITFIILSDFVPEAKTIKIGNVNESGQKNIVSFANIPEAKSSISYSPPKLPYFDNLNLIITILIIVGCYILFHWKIKGHKNI